MNLKLEGHLSHIDGQKLHFVYLWGDYTADAKHSKDKLAEHCGGNQGRATPMTKSGFVVCLGAGRGKIKKTPIPEDIQGLVGLDCDIWVKTSSYSFVSKFEKNYGQKIEGVQLILQDIKPMAKYST